MTWALHESESERLDRLVLLSIAECINADTGVCWPSVGYLATVSRVSIRTTREALRRLEVLGEITTEPRQEGGWKSSIYRMPKVPFSRTRPSANGADPLRQTAPKGSAVAGAEGIGGSAYSHKKEEPSTEPTSEPIAPSVEEATHARTHDNQGSPNLIDNNGNGSDSSAPARARLRERARGAILRTMTDAWNAHCHAMQQSMAKPPEPTTPRGRSMLAFWQALDAATPEGATARDLWVLAVQAFAADPFWNRTGKTADRADPFSVDHLVRANQRDARVERVATALRAPVRPSTASGRPEWFRPMQRPVEAVSRPFPGIPATADGLPPL